MLFDNVLGWLSLQYVTIGFNLNETYKLYLILALKKGYGVSCTSSTQCNNAAGLICPTTVGSCNCPLNQSSIFCDCASGRYYDYTSNTCCKFLLRLFYKCSEMPDFLPLFY